MILQSINCLVQKIIVSGGSFNISGTAKDLSAQRATPGNGGAGMKQVDWELVFLNPDGSLVQPNNSQEGTTSSAVKKNPISNRFGKFSGDRRFI